MDWADKKAEEVIGPKHPVDTLILRAIVAQALREAWDGGREAYRKGCCINKGLLSDYPFNCSEHDATLGKVPDTLK